MDLLSFRGPNAPGGVSSALQAIWSDPRCRSGRWWHFDESALRFSLEPHSPSMSTPFKPELLEKHYRFCNDFIWPLMHDIPEQCVFRPEEYQAYVQLQSEVSEIVDRRVDHLFVNDYHFALIPNMVSAKTSIFWHIPWPAQVPDVWRNFISELAQKMLSAERIGFHCVEYANNFLSFLNPILHAEARTKLVVAPIGIDAEMWKCRALETELELQFVRPYILSVDRCDYTKGVFERLSAIEQFFEQHDQYVGKIQFVQLCTRSRAGIAAYDNYWNKCRAKTDAINARWASGSWKPVVWLDEPMGPDDLARLYAGAQALLVTSLKDGLNLTAKEFVMCQADSPGVLILSRSAGVWHELGHLAVSIEPTQIRSIVAGIFEALQTLGSERQRRSLRAKQIIENDSLIHWYRRFELDSTANKVSAISRVIRLKAGATEKTS